MIPHFTESLSFHFLNWAGLSGINSNPPKKKKGVGWGAVAEEGGGLPMVLWGVKAERIKDARAKAKDPTAEKVEFATLSSVLRLLQPLADALTPAGHSGLRVVSQPAVLRASPCTSAQQPAGSAAPRRLQRAARLIPLFVFWIQDLQR